MPDNKKSKSKIQLFEKQNVRAVCDEKAENVGIGY
jgi:hypothetical protein